MFDTVNNLYLYNTGICNLKCKYCYLTDNTKSPITEQKIIDSFKGDYYINFAKELLGDKLKQVNYLSIWGAETSLYLDRTFDFMESLIKEDPNFNNIFFPSNCTQMKLLENLEKLMDLLGKYKDRSFTVSIETSLDGPEYINDLNRGEGCFKSFFKVFNELCKNRFFLKDYYNLRFCFGCNATLAPNTIALLSNKYNLLGYYKFVYENILIPIYNLSDADNRITCDAGLLFNIAEPYQYTVQDGINFANLCKIAKELDDDGLDTYGFENVKYITPYINTAATDKYILKMKNFDVCNTICSGCFNALGLLPDRKITRCIKNFSSELPCKYTENNPLMVQIRRQDKPSMVLSNESEIKNFLRITDYDRNKSNVHGNPNLIMYATLIKALAKAGQVDKELVDDKKALEAAIFMVTHTGICINDAFAICGSYIIPYLGRLRLYLNGAYKYTIDAYNSLVEKEIL